MVELDQSRLSIGFEDMNGFHTNYERFVASYCISQDQLSMLFNNTNTAGLEDLSNEWNSNPFNSQEVVEDVSKALASLTVLRDNTATIEVEKRSIFLKIVGEINRRIASKYSPESEEILINNMRRFADLHPQIVADLIQSVAERSNTAKHFIGNVEDLRRKLDTKFLFTPEIDAKNNREIEFKDIDLDNETSRILDYLNPNINSEKSDFYNYRAAVRELNEFQTRRAELMKTIGIYEAQISNINDGLNNHRFSMELTMINQRDSIINDCKALRQELEKLLRSQFSYMKSLVGR